MVESSQTDLSILRILDTPVYGLRDKITQIISVVVSWLLSNLYIYPAVLPVLSSLSQFIHLFIFAEELNSIRYSNEVKISP